MPDMASPRSKVSWHTPAAWLYLLVLALLIYVILPQIGTFHRSLPLLGNAKAGWLVAAVGLSLVAHMSAGFKYVSLALKPLKVYPTVLIQLAGLLVNRLLPAGIGGIGINYAYLYKAKHNKVEAGVVVTMNNLIGFVGHMLLIVVLLLFGSASSRLHVGLEPSAVLVVALLLAVVLAIVSWQRKKMAAALKQLGASLYYYRAHPLKLLYATLWSVIIAAAYAACLWASAHALGVQLAFVPALIVLTFGVAASTVTPTPGGLVGVEAALVAGLVAYHIPSTMALAIALLFRLITYWFALFLGCIAFIVARKQKYI
jgi:uncharacterized protein (TIRG00374 family)